MYEPQRSTSNAGSSGAPAGLEGKIGGSPRVQGAAVDDPARGAMFAGAPPAWEDVEAPEQAIPEPPRPHAAKAAVAPTVAHETEPQGPPADGLDVVGEHDSSNDAEDGEVHATARAAAAAPAAAAPAAAAPAAAAPAAAPKDPLHIAGKTNAHGGPFERTLAHADTHYGAKTDEYNKKAVHSDKATKHVAARPGAISNGKGLFKVKHDATRYTYTANGDNNNIATPFDVIKKDQLTSVNAKNSPKHRLLLNPSKSRQLMINNVKTWCVLSWTDGFGGGAAWIPLKDLAGDTSQIHHAVDARAKKWDPSTKLADSAPYIIRDDAVGQADAKDKAHGGRMLRPNSHNGDNVSHYLEKDGAKLGGNKGFVALCMNLPEAGTPPVADDTARAGDTFFAFTNAKFHREVAVYENGKKSSKLRQTWVFGHLGQHKGGAGPDAAEMEPDPNRAGWVPLRVLKLA